MMRKIVWSIVIILVLAVAAGAAYFYYYSSAGYTTLNAPATTGVIIPTVQPDTTVLAGPVTAISAKSISVRKQDGTTLTLSIASTTQVMLAGQTAAPKKVSDIKTGAAVLVTPSTADATVAQSIVLLPAPPAQ